MSTDHRFLPSVTLACDEHVQLSIVDNIELDVGLQRQIVEQVLAATSPRDHQVRENNAFCNYLLIQRKG